MLACDFTGGRVLGPDQRLATGRVSIADGRIVTEVVGKSVDVGGFLILPGIVDAHGDGFERHVAPRRGAMTDLSHGLLAVDAELAANGITTAVIAQFMSWEGGLRGPEFADKVLTGIAANRAALRTDLMPQLRFEVNLLDAYATLPERLAAWNVRYVVFNDHLPHDRLRAGRKPPRMTGQALKAGRNPEDYFAMLLALEERACEVPAALDGLTEKLHAAGVRLGSHDDRTAQDRATWRARSARVAEFPESREAAEAARSAGDNVVMGAPNVVRGASHNGNVSALEIVRDGLCDALASDYHYPALRRAVQRLSDDEGMRFVDAWHLVSAGPAMVLGLEDRGRLAPGLRADLVIMEAQTGRIAGTISGGQVSYLAGDLAQRFLGST